MAYCYAQMISCFCPATCMLFSNVQRINFSVDWLSSWRNQHQRGLNNGTHILFEHASSHASTRARAKPKTKTSKACILGKPKLLKMLFRPTNSFWASQGQNHSQSGRVFFWCKKLVTWRFLCWLTEMIVTDGDVRGYSLTLYWFAIWLWERWRCSSSHREMCWRRVLDVFNANGWDSLPFACSWSTPARVNMT